MRLTNSNMVYVLEELDCQNTEILTMEASFTRNFESQGMLPSIAFIQQRSWKSQNWSRHGTVF